MSHQPSEEDAGQSLRDHVVAKAGDARRARGGVVDRAELFRLLDDRAVVRYPMGVRFDAEPLRPGEFACLQPLGEHPRQGFCLFVHPMFEPDEALLPLIVAYFIPSVNYGDVATHVEAELFGSTLLGLDIDEYYALLCRAADAVMQRGDGGGGCGPG